MARPAAQRPTDQEMEILKVLWQRGPSSVRDVWTEIATTREIGYTSVLKIMQIMRDKQLLVCDARERPQIFRPRQNRTTVLRHMAGDLLNRVFGGSTRLLLLHAIESKKRSPAELAELRELLESLDSDDK